MSALWALIDEAVRSIIEEEMGPASAYLTDQLDNVQIVETWDYYKPPYPRGLVYSTNSSLGTGGFGDGLPHIDLVYEYMVVIVGTADSYAECRTLTQTLHARAKAALRSRWTDIVGLSGDGGEESTNIDWRQAFIEIRGRNNPGTLAGAHIGVAGFVFDVEAEI